MPKYQNESLKRGLSVLSTVADNAAPIGATEVANRTGLDYATTYRLLATLIDLGYIERSEADKRYSPSIGTLRLGYSYLRNNALYKAAIPIMRELLAKTGETVNLGCRHDTDMILLESCESDHLLGSRLNRSGRYPLHATASGKVMLAFAPNLPELLAQLSLDLFTEHTVTTISALSRDLERVRERGWALNDEEYVIGLRSVSAPIFGQHSELLAAIDISVPTVRFTTASLTQELAPLIVEYGRRISSSLGWQQK
ncbi:MAG: IclR family transcriptional regulator [Proteobacteria bacterium]|nr:IclR family transcriptional regulator [Pseudomonadota bacterium]